MKKLLICGLLGMNLVGCATYQNYQNQQYPVTQNNGTIQAVQHYQQQNRDPSMLGGVVGAVGGAAIGSVMGGGTGKIATMMGGAVLGGVAGSQIAASSNAVDMVNLTIMLDSGQTIQVPYQDKGFRVGQRVVVQQQGTQYMVYPI